MRLIDADALLSRLKQPTVEDINEVLRVEYDNAPNDVLAAEAIHNMYETVREAIKDAPTVESPRPNWTPCADGLPTKEQAMDGKSYRHFHVTITDSTGKRDDAVEDCAWRNGEWYMFEYDCNLSKTEWVAVAWKAYPAPYRADDTTGKVKEGDVSQWPEWKKRAALCNYDFNKED